VTAVVAFHASTGLVCNELRENLRASAGLGVNLEPASADEDLPAMNVTIDVDLTPSEARVDARRMSGLWVVADIALQLRKKRQRGIHSGLNDLCGHLNCFGKPVKSDLTFCTGDMTVAQSIHAASSFCWVSIAQA